MTPLFLSRADDGDGALHRDPHDLGHRDDQPDARLEAGKRSKQQRKAERGIGQPEQQPQCGAGKKCTRYVLEYSAGQ